MSANNSSSSDYQVGDMEELTSTPRKIPSIPSLLHILWLRKWVAFTAWLVVSIPVGILLSIYNLPKSYTSATVMRFPQVVGAQTNVMRDVAITEGQSIISIFNSYQVLDAAIKKLSLRLRITTANTFHRDAFKEANYGENLGIGRYTIELENRGSTATIQYKPALGTSAYKIFSGPLREVGHLVIPELDLQFKPEFLQDLKGTKIELEFMSFEDAFRDLRKNVSARPLGGGNFEIKLKDRDPYLVAEILNTLRDQFLEVYYGTSEVQDVGILVQMEKDLELAKSRLEQSQDELSKYYAAHPELIQQQGPSQSENMAYLESRQQMTALELRKKRVQQAFAAKEDVPEPEKMLFWALELLSAMSEAGEAKANIFRNSLNEMNSRLMAHKRTLAPEHPKIKAAEAEMMAVYKEIEETEANLIRRMDQDLADAQQRLTLNTPRGVNRPAVKVQLELERLNNNNTNNQNIYDRLNESYNKAKLVTGSEFFKVTVVDPARPALYKPPSTKTRLFIAAAAVLFLMVIMPGLVLVWGLVFIKIWTKDDVRRLLTLKTLGEIRLNKKKKSKNKKLADNKNAKAADSSTTSATSIATTMSTTTNSGSVDPLLLVYGELSRGEDLEAFRHVREEIENVFRNRANPGKFCIMITSSRPHEGKSTCASNLAITFARKGKRTLLIDADFRLGRTAKIFNLTVGTGIDTLLDQTDMTAAQFLESATLAFQPTLQRNLVVAPRQSSRPNASELISSDRFKAFIRLSREQFDVVIIDTPPIMITPEPLSLAELTDGVVFVCRAGLTVASEAREAIEILQERTKKVAVILNGVKTSPFQENRYTKYSYYYQGTSQPDSEAKEGS
jgi:capsular exopolysaccharide synthesis family protein